MILEGELTENDPCLWCFLDGKMKMEIFAGRISSTDTLSIDVSITNKARIKEYIWLPTAMIRGTHVYGIIIVMGKI